jgi:hypothetical protein
VIDANAEPNPCGLPVGRAQLVSADPLIDSLEERLPFSVEHFAELRQ